MEEVVEEATVVQPQTIDEGKYLHFILMAETCLTNEPKSEVYRFTLESLARTVDAAYNEGRLNQFVLDNPSWEDNAEYVETYTELMGNIESSIQVPVTIPDDAYEDEGYIDMEDSITYSGDEEE